MFTHLLVSIFFINIKKNRYKKIILFFIRKFLNKFFILYKNKYQKLQYYIIKWFSDNSSYSWRNERNILYHYIHKKFWKIQIKKLIEHGNNIAKISMK